jgi:hypothetical protein
VVADPPSNESSRVKKLRSATASQLHLATRLFAAYLTFVE